MLISLFPWILVMSLVLIVFSSIPIDDFFDSHGSSCFSSILVDLSLIFITSHRSSSIFSDPSVTSPDRRPGGEGGLSVQAPRGRHGGRPTDEFSSIMPSQATHAPFNGWVPLGGPLREEFRIHTSRICKKGPRMSLGRLKTEEPKEQIKTRKEKSKEQQGDPQEETERAKEVSKGHISDIAYYSMTYAYAICICYLLVLASSGQPAVPIAAVLARGPLEAKPTICYVHMA